MAGGGTGFPSGRRFSFYQIRLCTCNSGAFQVILRGQEGREPPKLQDTFIPGHGGDLAGGHQFPAKPLHILAVTFRLSPASALGLHGDGGLAQPIFRNILRVEASRPPRNTILSMLPMMVSEWSLYNALHWLIA